MKYVICLVVLFAVVSGNEYYFRRLDAIKPEPACNAQGGICTFAEDCPQLTEDSGLCPKQRSQGIECCLGVSIRETRCYKMGGQCIPGNTFCAPRLIAPSATDCPSDHKCCILV